MATTSPTTATLARSLNAIKLTEFSNEIERIQALQAAYALIGRLETPWETIVRLGMNQPALSASLKVSKDLELFEKWHGRDDVPMTSSQVAAMVGADDALLVRLLRHLAANHMLEEPSEGMFKPTPFTLSLVAPVFGEWIHYIYDAMIPCFYKMPEYLSKTGYKNPVDPANGVFQFAKNYKGDLFQYYDSHSREGQSFNHVMGAVMAQQASWLDIIPHDRIVADHLSGQPLVVDVGGNIGHDLERFREAHPETATDLYLQDRAEVIQHSKCPDPVNKMAHDFFQSQPIQGSRVYYMHGVLHDWPDEQACNILKMTREAMRPGYSRLLIHDHVVQEQMAHPHTTSYDLTMMVKIAGQERTESQWTKLLRLGGLKVVKIWRSPLAVQGIIEAELAEEAVSS
ncbi:S-adenosyl-L-methionine-dependent methyltransferase [Daldinia loculata]|uniref:S-adenosyl-L-methionine-dependent methyltransferase n=1 Tax=Daldinia loculata TaxID=103429 RepID=UPI0020C370E3|nr:S-adenosyl-L-methionine-dependent methyltransferase [Daldinia loculata]KAI1645978.1 S-adenosyl-L-methionine-dependent methyltransferase [Daldinia loculata]